MSKIVLVHGIGQEQESADTLEAAWIPALAGGVRTAGRPELADRLWRQARPGDLECRMAFYGDLFLVPGRMGGGQTVEDLTPQQQDLAAELAVQWLRQAEERAPLEEDRDEAHRQLHAMNTKRQGGWGGARPDGRWSMRWRGCAGSLRPAWRSRNVSPTGHWPRSPAT